MRRTNVKKNQFNKMEHEMLNRHTRNSGGSLFIKSNQVLETAQHEQ